MAEVADIRVDNPWEKFGYTIIGNFGFEKTLNMRVDRREHKLRSTVNRNWNLLRKINYYFLLWRKINN